MVRSGFFLHLRSQTSVRERKLGLILTSVYDGDEELVAHSVAGNVSMLIGVDANAHHTI